MQIAVAEIEQKLGYTFANKDWLKLAFVHSSYANVENVCDNERMEFLGDAILSVIVSEYIYSKYPEFPAGQLSKMRAAVVSAEALRPVVDKLDILQYLLIAKGANVKTISRKIEANLYEAVLCAIYFDGGMPEACRFVEATLKEQMDTAILNIKQDYKTVLQEYCQKNKLSICYKQEERSGPDNNPKFVYSLWIDGKKVSCGSGSGIKLAQQDAASKIVKEWRIDKCFI